MAHHFITRLLLLTLWLLLLLPTGAARAGGTQPCTYPSVFEGAAVNALILPYRFDGPRPGAELQLAGRQISALVHLEVLMGLLKYSSVGAKDLLSPDGRPCDVEQVLARVTRPGQPGALRPGKALLLVWGRLFEQGGELHLQSYLRFVRQGPQGPLPEALQLEAAQGETRLRLSAGLPTQALAFAPRRISREELARVDREFRAAMVMRERPSLDAPGRPLDFDPYASFAYWVAEARGDWMLIKPMESGRAGWVRARVPGSYGEEGGGENESWSLRRWMPELAYIDAVAGFLRLQVGEAMSEAMSAGAARAMERGLARHERSVDVQQAAQAWSLAAALRAWLAWQQGQREVALALMEKSAALSPDLAAGRQLLAAMRAASASLNRDSAARLSDDLLAALALAPSSAQVLGNLDRLYGIYEKRPDWSLFEPAVLQERREIVRGALAQEGTLSGR